MNRKLILLLALLVLAATSSLVPPRQLPARAAADSIATGKPNDPQWAQCESQDQLTGCTDGEEWDHFGPLTDAQFPCAHGLPHPDAGANGGLPCWANQAADDPTHMSGLNLPGAWTQGNTGRSDVVVAYIEGGVNFSSDSVKDAIDNEYLNTAELPCPQRADGSSKAWPNCYDLDGNGRVDIRDYIHDPRVNPGCTGGVTPDVTGTNGGLHLDQEAISWNCLAGGQHAYLNAVHVGGFSDRVPYLTPEDLVAVFGHCLVVQGALGACPAGGKYDNDGNGYANDISGWNFDRNTNDPQSEDLTYNHAPSLHALVAGVPDNNYGSVGYCANCRVVPIRQGAECLGRSDKWGESILYAADLGVTAISSVVVGYSYSAFNQAAINYAYNKGVLLSLDSNDFDSMDHTDGMLFDHVIPGNSVVEDKATTGVGAASTANTVTWFRARSNVTSYGTHNIFSMEGGSTSAATPTVAAVLAMVQSAGFNLRDSGHLAGFDRLSPNEVKQVLMDTSSEIVPQNPPEPAGDGAPPALTASQWPGNPNSATDATHTNWSTQYGYGRPDLGAATSMVMAGHIPPTADITSPQWFKYVDPSTTTALGVDASLAPSRFHSGGSATYTLEWALGADPADSAFHTIGSGTVSQATSGRLGTIDMTDPAIVAYAAKAPGVSLQPDGAEQYTLSIRLRVKDANGIKAEDRRSIGIRHDPTLNPGYPILLDHSDGIAPAYADLEGQHQLDLVAASSNGDLHAFRPDGSEVPGFPVYTDTVRSLDPNSPQNFPAAAYRVPALRDVRDPISGGVAVGDLFHTGELEVLATTTNGEVYAWDSHGNRLPGFPRAQDPAHYAQYSVVPTPHLVDAHHNPTANHLRLPARGGFAPPVLADLEGTGKLDALVSGYDGWEYAWRPDGTAVPGWPVRVKLPAADFTRDGVDPLQYIWDAKLFYPASVADVEKAGRPQVFVPSFESNGVGTATENLVQGLLGVNGQPSGAATWLYGIWADGNNHPGGPYIQNWPVKLNSLDFTYDQSIDFVGEAASPPLVADFDHSGTLRLATGVVTGQVLVLNPDGTIYSTADTACTGVDCAPNPPYRQTGDTHTITLTGTGAVGDLANNGTPQVVMNNTGLESILTGLGGQLGAQLPQVYEKAWTVASGTSPVVSGWPKRVDGFPFFASPTIADVAGAGGRAAIEGNDNYFVHAFAADGSEPAGFPKYTGQWVGFAGVAADPLMNGQMHYTIPTREGAIFDWKVPGDTTLNDSWWRYRHDEHNTGAYGVDTRRPASVLDLAVTGTGSRTLSWTAPGDDYMVGKAKSYDVRWANAPITSASFWTATPISGAPAPGSARSAQQFSSTAGTGTSTYFAMRSVDAAGNISALSNVVCLGLCPPPVTVSGGGLPNTAGAANPVLAVALVILAVGLLGARRRRRRTRAAGADTGRRPRTTAGA